MNQDFVEMLDALSAAGVEYLIVGAHALAAYGHPRATGDLDIWIRPTAENGEKVWQALVSFGAPLDQLRPEDLSSPETVFQIGIAPSRVDILTSLTALDFESAWSRRTMWKVEGRDLPFLSREDLIRNKTALGRPRDLADVDDLLK